MGKGHGQGGNSAVDASDQEVLINGRLYDVSNFKHPGGSVIKFLTGGAKTGGDATEAFVEFHGRSKKASAVLKGLESRAAPAEVMKVRGFNGKEELTKDYAKLRKEFASEGLFDPSPVHVVYRVAEIILMHALGAYLFLTAPGAPSAAALGTAQGSAGLLLLGIVSGRCGWLMHEGGHYTLTGKISTDRALQIIVYGVGCGMSGAWWRNQHNKHHATPQKLKHDVDLDTLPLVAFNEKVSRNAKHPLLKAWLRNQAVLFTPVSCLLVALGWQYFLHPRHIVRTKRVHTEGAALLLRHLLFFGGLCQGMSWGQSVGTYLLYNAVASAYIFSQFAMSHTHLPVSGPDEFLHWVEYASLHTTNINPGRFKWVSWFMGYLNFQIEHHLFPGMPQFRHPHISPRVKLLFQKHGLPYDERDWGVCLKETWMNLHEVGQSVGSDKKSS